MGFSFKTKLKPKKYLDTEKTSNCKSISHTRLSMSFFYRNFLEFSVTAAEPIESYTHTLPPPSDQLYCHMQHAPSQS